jgi:hypothetical protein
MRHLLLGSKYGPGFESAGFQVMSSSWHTLLRLVVGMPVLPSSERLA